MESTFWASMSFSTAVRAAMLLWMSEMMAMRRMTEAGVYSPPTCQGQCESPYRTWGVGMSVRTYRRKSTRVVCMTLAPVCSPAWRAVWARFISVMT